MRILSAYGVNAIITPAFTAMLLMLSACSGDKKDGEVGDSTPQETGTPSLDEDGDGYEEGEDCDDGNAGINPSVEEECDGVDNNCDGDIDEGVMSTWYGDNDDDGFGNTDVSVESCEPPDGYVPTDGDCLDTDPSYYPGAPEDDCTDENDYNCDGSVGFTDADGDGVAACEDCDDADDTRSPDADEICDGIDNDCDDLVDGADDSLDGSSLGTWYQDADNDKYGDADASMVSCEQPDGYVADSTDCDDDDTTVNPEATEVCDEVDNDCDGEVDNSPADGSIWYADTDGDTYGDAGATTVACDSSDGWVSNDDDCDDADGAINPDATEVCDGEDNDCDRAIDDADRSVDESTMSTWYADEDEDSYGDADNTVTSCDMPSGYLTDDNDCDDADDGINPAATEVCDGIDNDCDNRIDAADSSLDTSTVPTWYEDADSDTYGDPSSSQSACSAPDGYVADSTDCDDSDDGVNPAEDEVCDNVDQDCDGSIDEDAADGGWYPQDEDEDGFGSEAVTWACAGPSNNWDCNDATAGEPQVVRADASASAAEGTLDNPWPTIQEGIDEADQCVVVFAGTYNEAIDFGGRDISVTGVNGAADTIIDATETGLPVVTFASGETADASLSGFTLTGGEGNLTEETDSYSCGSGDTCTTTYQIYCGGGVYVDGASPTLSDLVIEDNALPEASTTESGDDTTYVASYGGGVCLINATVTMTGVNVFTSFADQGGAIYVDEDSSLSHGQSAVVANSSAEGGAYAVEGGELELVNIASSWNQASTSAGGVFLVDSTFSATNVTFGGDDAADVGGIFVGGSSVATVLNTIVYGAATGYGVWVDSTATFDGSYNNVYDNAAGEYYGITDPTGSSGNISGNPRFADVSNDGAPWNDDWHLRTTSASYNTGDPDDAYDDADGTRNDMGAYGGPLGGWE